MRQVRSSVFETNSSSTHCICISTDRAEALDVPECVTFKCHDFGWEKAEYRSVEWKASYLYSSILSLYERKKAEKAKSWIMDQLARVGVRCVFEMPEYDKYDGLTWCNNASVDHAGEDDHTRFVESVLRNGKRLLRYLFSEKSVVITGNDNSGDDDVDNFTAEYPHEYYYKGN